MTATLPTKPTAKEITECADRLVRNDVHLCLSSLIYELTGPESRGEIVPGMSEEDRLDLWTPIRAEVSVCDECGVQCDGDTCPKHPDATVSTEEDENSGAEVYEHWAVSSFLARKLGAHNERIVELYGLNIWCRTTTGQSISMDGVMEDIAREVMEAR